MKDIAFVVSGYPTKTDPSYAFIQPIVHAIADRGYHCTVIAPQNMTAIYLKGREKKAKRWKKTTESGNYIEIIRPSFISFSTAKLFGNNLSQIMRLWALKKTVRQLHLNPDVVYAHFWDNGVIAGIAFSHVPVFVGVGESKIRVRRLFSDGLIKRGLKSIKGVISVSTENIKESKELALLTSEMKECILPNGVNKHIFCQMDKVMAREQLRFRQEDLIAIFVGTFCERKGVLRVVEAAKRIPDIKLILIGKGEQKPESDQIIYMGQVPHDEIPIYLSASDFFVLPTQAEGCCNAIIEGMACGLPIISSDGEFNDDILNSSNSIRINPNSIDEIAAAMKKLAEDYELRKRMSEASLDFADELSIEKRACKIVEFIETMES